MGCSSESSFDPPPEQAAIRARCFHPSGTFIKFSKKEIEQSVPERLEKIVRKYPEQTAVKTRTHSFSYQELNQLANRIAHAILERRGDVNEPVALLVAKDAPMVSAILGVLKSGKAYVPLDLSHPVSTSGYIMDDTRVKLILTDNGNLSTATELAKGQCELLNIEKLGGKFSPENPSLTISADSLAYIRYTSGSTGQPKGVMENHCNLLHVVMRQTNSFHICAEDRLVFLGAWGKHIFRGLLNGATLYLSNIREEGLRHLDKWLAEEEITICHSTPSVFRHFIEVMSGRETFPHLRIIRLAGEPVSRKDVELFKKHFSYKCLLVNELGGTEAGTIAHYFIDKETQITTDMVPVGYPEEDAQILLLDDGRRVDLGQVGEIAIKSKYLFPGYWQRPELTAAAFLTESMEDGERIYLTGDLGILRADGCLVHVGRKDFQLKIRGNRVEVNEIETALSSHPGVKDAVVIGRQDRNGNQRLLAYLVPSIKPAPSVKDLRSFLSARVPDYMVPTAFVILDALPLTPNGKVDRNTLPEPEDRISSVSQLYIPPRTAVEQKLARIWAEVLSVEKVGIHDNFFDLGGHSLLAAKLFARLDEEFGISTPLSVLFAAPTVQAFAERYCAFKELKPNPVLVALRTGGSLHALYAVPGVFGNVVGYADLSRELGPEQPFYAFQSVGLDGASPPLDSVEEMAKRNVSGMREVQPHGPYAIIGACFGATVAYEMARQILSEGEEIAFLGLLDPAGRERYETSAIRLLPRQVINRTKAICNLVTGRVQLYLTEMGNLDNRVRIKFITNKIRSLLVKTRNRKSLKGVQREFHQLEVYQANRQALRRYHPKPLAGCLKAFEIFESCHPRNIAVRRFKWEALWEGVAVRHRVPGKDSGEMLSGENVGVLAPLLAKRLRSAFSQESTAIDTHESQETVLPLAEMSQMARSSTRPGPKLPSLKRFSPLRRNNRHGKR
jgi:amino acid adenylation domain-containing protein